MKVGTTIIEIITLFRVDYHDGYALDEKYYRTMEDALCASTFLGGDAPIPENVLLLSNKVYIRMPEAINISNRPNEKLLARRAS
jgi:hypothetical protein